MSDQLLKDRQDAPIWNAIEASNFKQALKLVDKRLAKKRTPHLEVSLTMKDQANMFPTQCHPSFSKRHVILSGVQPITKQYCIGF
jgi:hypothetical protein